VLRLAFTSLHIQRRAVDFFIEGVARDALAAFARSHPLMKDRGGIGRYRGTDIVHIDSGKLRSWCWGCGKKGSGDDPLGSSAQPQRGETTSNRL
jgi:Bacterial protein of unknown function (DUF882)